MKNTERKKYRMDDYEEPIEYEGPKLNYTYEIIKSLMMASITFIIEVAFGPGLAIATLLSLYFFSQRFADILNDELYQGEAGQIKRETARENDGVPDGLNQINWETVSKIPGVDAERLKWTFEDLYRKVHKGTLEVNETTGEWNSIDNNQRKSKSD